MAGISRSFRRRPKALPLSISGLQLWLDASDSSTLFTDSAGTTPASNDGDPIGCWKDKSGNAKHATQSDGTKKPLLKLAQKNGRNVVNYDGVNDNLRGTSGVSTGTYSGAIHAFFSATRSSKVGDGSYFVERTSIPSKAFQWLNYNGSNYYVSSDGTAWANQISQSDFNLYNVNGAVISHKQTGTATDVVRLNKSSISLLSGAGYGSVSGTDGYIVGERENNYGQRWTGNMFELIVFTSTLTDSQVISLENYLNAKWSIY